MLLLCFLYHCFSIISSVLDSLREEKLCEESGRTTTALSIRSQLSRTTRQQLIVFSFSFRGSLDLDTLKTTVASLWASVNEQSQLNNPYTSGAH